MRVAFTTAAKSDLAGIARFIARQSPERARSFSRELRMKALALGDSPLAFPIMARFSHEGVRRRVFGDYLILYRVEADRVVVIHIVHGARDYEALLETDALREPKEDNDHG